LTTWANDGLIPQARHGGNGVRTFANAGSKFDGTGFEKEQIVQIQVALIEGGGGAAEPGRRGLPWRAGGVDEGLPWLEIAGCMDKDVRLEALGYRATLGDDLKNLAYFKSARFLTPPGICALHTKSSGRSTSFS
jgi:hypothetical protein